MRTTLEFAASAIVMLLVTIGPVETAAIFAVLTAGARRRLACEAIAIAGGVLVLFAVGGTRLLALMHVGVPAFQVAAGILLLLQSIDLLFAAPTGLSALTASEEKEAEGPSEIALFPLAVPLIAGPASITAAMLLMGQAVGDPLKIAIFFVALLVALGLAYAALLLVESLGRLLGITGHQRCCPALRHPARGACGAAHLRRCRCQPPAPIAASGPRTGIFPDEFDDRQGGPRRGP